MLHLRQKVTSLYFHFSWFIIAYDLSGLYSRNNSFGSRVFQISPYVGNGNSSEKELQTSVLGCLNKIICSLDK